MKKGGEMTNKSDTNKAELEEKQNEVLDDITPVVANAVNQEAEQSTQQSTEQGAQLEAQQEVTQQEIAPQEMLVKLHEQTVQINEQLDKLNNHKLVHTYNSLMRFVWFSLLKGIAVGLGSVLGATVVLSFLVYLLSQMEFIPIVGEWVSSIIEVVKEPESN
jgi:hypothetical protein